MHSRDSLTVLALPGRGYDERVWGSFLPRLRRNVDVVLLEHLEGLAGYVDPVVMAISEATASAVHAARDGRVRALVLMAPTATQALPEITVDIGPRADEGFKIVEVIQAAATTDDREQRRAVLADGLMRLYGQGIGPEDLAALRAMFYDHADKILDPAWEQASRQPPYEDELAELAIPVLVVGAGGDPYIAEIARAIAGRIPGSDLALLDTAQILFPWLAQPEAAVQAISRFLAAL
jgi:pimeloyl-ACP methyl ester carboxylesterase